MHYKPHWRKIILMSIVLHLFVLFGVSLIWSSKTSEPEGQTAQELELVDVEFADEPVAEEKVTPVESPSVDETVSSFEFPPLVIPPPPEPMYIEPSPPPPLPVVETPPPARAKVQPKIKQTAEGKISQKIEEELGKEKNRELRVIAKAYPKDVVNELIEVGIIKEKQAINIDKVVIAVTIGTDGRVKKTEIQRGDSSDENSSIINILIEAAASKWIFEPFIGDDGNPMEMKTQIEFNPEDF